MGIQCFYFHFCGINVCHEFIMRSHVCCETPAVEKLHDKLDLLVFRCHNMDLKAMIHRDLLHVSCQRRQNMGLNHRGALTRWFDYLSQCHAGDEQEMKEAALGLADSFPGHRHLHKQEVTRRETTNFLLLFSSSAFLTATLAVSLFFNFLLHLRHVTSCPILFPHRSVFCLSIGPVSLSGSSPSVTVLGRPTGTWCC